MSEKFEKIWVNVLVLSGVVLGFIAGRWTLETQNTNQAKAATSAPAPVVQEDVKLTDHKLWKDHVVYPVDEDWGIEYAVYTGPGVPTFKRYVPLSDRAFAQMNPPAQDRNKRTTPKATTTPVTPKTETPKIDPPKDSAAPATVAPKADATVAPKADVKTDTSKKSN